MRGGWRSGTRRRNEFRLLADELAKRAKSPAMTIGYETLTRSVSSPCGYKLANDGQCFIMFIERSQAQAYDAIQR
jgi:hypothetical protein